jgi:hypothetical protein
LYTKIALQILYNEPDIVERLGVREDSLSSRWRTAKEGDVGLNKIETERVCCPVHSRQTAGVHRAGCRDRRTDVVGLGNTEGPGHRSPVFKYTCKLSIVTHACVS